MKYPIIGHTQAPSQSATGYYTLMHGSPTSAVTTETDASTPISESVTLDRLFFEVNTSPGSGKSWELTVMKNGVATSLQATLTDDNTSVLNSTDTVSLAAGDLVSLRVVPSGTPTVNPHIRWSIRGDSTSQQIIGRGDGSTNLTQYYNTFGYLHVGESTSETRSRFVVPTGGTISKLYFKVASAPGTGESLTLMVRKNTADTTLTAVISDTATSASDTSNSFSVSAGDRVAIRIVRTSGATSPIVSWGMLFTPTVDGESILGNGSDQLMNNSSSTNYDGIIGTQISTTSTAWHRHVLGGFTIKKISVGLSGTVIGGSYTTTLYKNGASTALSAATTGNVASTSADVEIADGDEVYLVTAASGSITSQVLNSGLLLVETPVEVANSGYLFLYGAGA